MATELVSQGTSLWVNNGKGSSKSKVRGPASAVRSLPSPASALRGSTSTTTAG